MCRQRLYFPNHLQTAAHGQSYEPLVKHGRSTAVVLARWTTNAPKGCPGLATTGFKPVGCYGTTGTHYIGFTPIKKRRPDAIGPASCPVNCLHWSLHAHVAQLLNANFIKFLRCRRYIKLDHQTKISGDVPGFQLCLLSCNPYTSCDSHKLRIDSPITPS